MNSTLAGPDQPTRHPPDIYPPGRPIDVPQRPDIAPPDLPNPRRGDIPDIEPHIPGPDMPEPPINPGKGPFM
jgi:hypothetical protein